jgi:hypothetical protein
MVIGLRNSDTNPTKGFSQFFAENDQVAEKYVT